MCKKTTALLHTLMEINPFAYFFDWKGELVEAKERNKD
jgi:hypothetical protein